VGSAEYKDILRKAYSTKNDSRDTCPSDISRVFAAFKMMEPENVRVVIIGQDPYPRTSDACGISFMSERPDGVPRSANSIRANLIKYGHVTKPEFLPPTADLRGWIEQGVLLVNTSFTVKAGEPNSQRELWANKVGEMIACIPKNSVALMLGETARAVNPPSAVRVLHTHPVLPSFEEFQTFDCFGQVNKQLVHALNLPPIDWACMSSSH